MIKTVIVMVSDENPQTDVSFVVITFPLISASTELFFSGDFETQYQRGSHLFSYPPPPPTTLFVQHFIVLG